MTNDSARLLIPILVVGVANIALNVFSQAAANQGVGFRSAVASGAFLLALLAGCVSFTGLLWVYQSKVGLASAILLMGAVSILGGALVGILILGNRLHPVEFALLFVIAALFLLRWRLAQQ